MDTAYIQNICEYFKNEKELPLDASQFKKEAFSFYKEYTKNNLSKEEIEKRVAYLKTIPLTYAEMRGFFG